MFSYIPFFTRPFFNSSVTESLAFACPYWTNPPNLDINHPRVAFSTPCFSPSLHRHSTFNRSRDANASWFSYHFAKAATTFANESLLYCCGRFLMSCERNGIQPLKKWRMDHCKPLDIYFACFSETLWQAMRCVDQLLFSWQRTFQLIFFPPSKHFFKLLPPEKKIWDNFTSRKYNTPLKYAWIMVTLKWG